MRSPDCRTGCSACNSILDKGFFIGLLMYEQTRAAHLSVGNWMRNVSQFPPPSSGVRNVV